MDPVQIAPGVYNVGVRDWNDRDFHGYSTDLGTTYNAFLVLDEKIALIDSVKNEFADQLIVKIARIVDPRKIDVVISNHTEFDHSGSLARVMHRVGEDKPLYCSKMGAKNLARHFPQKWNYQAVGSGEELKLGARTLAFLETRMIHWPDGMFSYLKEDGILFSSDGFGQHYAGPERFDEEIGDPIMVHAKKYFANILLLYAAHIEKLIRQKELSEAAWFIDSTAAAVNLGNPVLGNVILVGALAATGVLPLERKQFEAAISRRIKPDQICLNPSAFDTAASLI